MRYARHRALCAARRVSGASTKDAAAPNPLYRTFAGPPPMLPAVFPFVFAILWASSYAAAKIGLSDITPYMFVAVRLGIAALAAVVMVTALRRPWGPVRRRWPHLLIGGALVHGLALATAHKALISVAATPTAL